MLIVALVLAVVSLAALVTAVVTSNELIAWVCIGLSALGVLLLIIDAIRDRHNSPAAPAVLPADPTEVIAPVETIAPADTTEVIEPVIEPVASEPAAGDAVVIADDDLVTDYPDLDELERVEDHPDEVVYDEPDYDTPSDDEPEYPVAAEEAAMHTVSDAEVFEDDADADADAEVLEVPVTAASVSYSGTSEQPRADDSITVIYSGEPYAGESSSVTEAYVVVNADEPDTLTGADDSFTVTYADEIDDDESGSSGERRESDSGR